MKFKKIILKTATTKPVMKVENTTREKIFCAFSLFPSPIVLAIRALPPVPNIKPIAPTIIKNGMIKLMAANGVFQQSLKQKSHQQHHKWM